MPKKLDRTETKQERISRRIEAKLRAKQWYDNRVEERQRRQVTATVAENVTENLADNFVTATRIEYLTVTLLNNSRHYFSIDQNVQLKEQSRRIIEILRVERAVLVKQIADIDTTISTITRTCHLDNG